MKSKPSNQKLYNEIKKEGKKILNIGQVHTEVNG